jgi:general secretion pathway protein M
MKQYWYSLAARERQMIGFGLIAVVAIVLWAILWEPLQQRLSELRDEVPQKQATLAWMQSQSSYVQQLKAQAQTRAQQPTDATPLVTVIEQTAADVNIRNVIRRIEPEDNNSVKVWLTEAYFDPWIQWAEVLKQRGVQVAQATVDKSANDTVTIRATFTRG